MNTRTLGFTLRSIILLIFFSASTQADAISQPFSYSTSGDVGTYAGAPIGTFGFTGTSGTLLTPGSFSLGQFNAENLPPGAGLTYTNFPFYITMFITPVGQSSGPNTSEISIQGVLNGTVTGSTSSSVIANVTSIQPVSLSSSPPFDLSNFNVDFPQMLAPGGINGGNTTLMARVEPVPEPSLVAFFGLIGLGVAGRRVIRRRHR